MPLLLTKGRDEDETIVATIDWTAGVSAVLAPIFSERPRRCGDHRAGASFDPDPVKEITAAVQQSARTVNARLGIRPVEGVNGPR